MNPKITTPPGSTSSPPATPSQAPAAPTGGAVEKFDRVLGDTKASLAPAAPVSAPSTPASPMDLLRQAAPASQQPVTEELLQGESESLGQPRATKTTGEQLPPQPTGERRNTTSSPQALPPGTLAEATRGAAQYQGMLPTQAKVESPGASQAPELEGQPEELLTALPSASQTGDTGNNASGEGGASGEVNASRTTDRASEVNELVRTVASRVLVSDAANAGEVRITLQDSVLPGTEVIIQREAGQLQIRLVSNNPESLQFLQQHQQALQSGLQERLRGEELVVQVSQQGDSAETGQDGQQGRSRQQRDIYSEWQAEQD